MISTSAIFCRKPCSIFVTDLARVFTDHSKSGRPVLAKYMHINPIWAESSPVVSSSSGGIRRTSINALFGMTFHVIAPSSNLSRRIFFFRQPPLLSLTFWTTRLYTELPGWTTFPSLCVSIPHTLDLQMALDLRSRSHSAILSPCVSRNALFQPIFRLRLHMRRIRRK